MNTKPYNFVKVMEALKYYVETFHSYGNDTAPAQQQVHAAKLFELNTREEEIFEDVADHWLCPITDLGFTERLMVKCLNYHTNKKGEFRSDGYY